MGILLFSVHNNLSQCMQHRRWESTNKPALKCIMYEDGNCFWCICKRWSFRRRRKWNSSFSLSSSFSRSHVTCLNTSVWSQEYPGWQGYFPNMVVCWHNAQQDGSIPAVQDHKTYSKTQEPGEMRKWAGCVLPHRHVQHTLWPWTRSCPWPCIPSTDTSWRQLTPPSTWVSLSTKTQVGTNTLTCVELRSGQTHWQHV